jgi:aminoglycoside 6'-N-acetyltransferase
MIRRMTSEDLLTVSRWIREAHVERWFLPDTTAAAELEKYRQRVNDPFSPTIMCMVVLQGRPVGWCQWYRWGDFPAAAVSVGAAAAEIGADYAIGDPGSVGLGVGTAMIASLVDRVHQHYPRAGLVIAPEADNWPSRRVLEKNRFALVDVRPVITEPHDRPMAIYRRRFT